METLIYSRVSSESQDNQRQIFNLKTAAQEKGWQVRRTFQEKISGTIRSGSRNEFKALLDYIDKTPVQVVMVSEISRLGRRVVDVLNFVELLHEKGIALYIQQFNMLTLEKGRENPIAKLNKYQNVSDLLDKSELSVRRIAGITGHSINTVRKIKQLKEI